MFRHPPVRCCPGSAEVMVMAEVSAQLWWSMVTKNNGCTRMDMKSSRSTPAVTFVQAVGIGIGLKYRYWWWASASDGGRACGACTGSIISTARISMGISTLTLCLRTSRSHS